MTQPIGQSIVKETGVWEAWAPEAADDRVSMKRGRSRVITNESSGRLEWYRWQTDNYFIMTKLDPATEGTDEGWVYGVVNPKGEVTAAGKIQSCMGCHMKGTKDRMFGLANALKVEIGK